MVPGKYFFAFHRIKRAMIDSLGEPATSVLLGQFLGQRDPWHATLCTSTSLQDDVLTNDLPYEEIIAPRLVAMSEPEFFGEDLGLLIHGMILSERFGLLPQAIVSSKSNLFVLFTRAFSWTTRPMSWGHIQSGSISTRSRSRPMEHR